MIILICISPRIALTRRVESDADEDGAWMPVRRSQKRTRKAAPVADTENMTEEHPDDMGDVLHAAEKALTDEQRARNS